MEREKGWNTEQFESRGLKRKLAEGDRKYRRRKKNLPKDLVIRIKDKGESLNQNL